MGQDRPGGLAVSVVVATDGCEAIEPLVKSLAAQTISSELELVIVTTPTDAGGIEQRHAAAFGDVVVVNVKSLSSIAAARAAGVRASRAEFVYVAETHALLDPDALESLVLAHAGPWACVVPAFRNGNPRTAISWAAMFLYHGRWMTPGRVGAIEAAPSHNGLFKRDVLLAYGDELDSALSYGRSLDADLRHDTACIYMQPAAQLEHFNISRLRHWVRESFMTGRASATERAAHWPLTRRLAYVGAAPLLPVVWLGRVLRLEAWRENRERIPRWTLAAMVTSACLGIAGEVVGYLVGAGGTEASLTEYEINRAKYMREAML